MTDYRPYPWHGGWWDRFLERRRTSTLPHAILLTGSRGSGAPVFLEAASRYLLCESPAELACGTCKSCQLVLAGVHPDLLRLQPEEGSRAIKVDQVREVVDFAQKSAQFGGYRVVQLTPAESLNVQAANALLKTLEEPGERTVLLLYSDRPLELLPTIRSRCQRWDLPRPSETDALAWLTPLVGGTEQAQLAYAFSRGEPLRALELIEQGWQKLRPALLEDLAAVLSRKLNAVSAAAKWGDTGPEALAELATLVVEDLVRALLGRQDRFNNPDLVPRFAMLSGQLDLAALLVFLQRLASVRREVAGNVQPQLLTENLFIEWGRVGLKQGVNA